MKSLILVLSLLGFSWAQGAAQVGAAAPGFEVKDTTGKVQKLSDYKGKWVVIEWFNKDCPFVKKHYGSGNMQSLQKDFKAKDVAWLSVASFPKGKKGPKGLESGSEASALLLDEGGAMVEAYGAKTTPHMFVINPEGKLVYAGAIDDNESSNPKVIPKSKNFVRLALEEGMVPNGMVTTSSHRPYGCSIKL